MRTQKSLKHNLHSGFVVKTRNGSIFAVVRTGNYKLHLASPGLSLPLRAYRSNLLFGDQLNPNLDIMEIYGLIRGDHDPYEALTHSLNTENRPLLWKRLEENLEVNTNG